MRWAQLNVALSRGPGEAGATAQARLVFERITPLLEQDRRHGELGCFYFMRKAPDMRLRFGFDDEAALHLGPYQQALSALSERGVVRRVHSSIYEPEERLFGGHEAMALVHEHFDADARLWMVLDRLSAEGRATLPHDVLVTAVLNDLYRRALEGSTEVWDTWCNVLLTQQPVSAPQARSERFDLRQLLLLVGAPEAEVLRRYQQANQALAQGLSALWSAGRLGCGLRALLPFVALFHFNRFGMDSRTRAELACAMVEAWDPRRDMRGNRS